MVTVETVKVERTPVPAEFLVLRTKSTVPAGITYGEAVSLWAQDRAMLDKANAQLKSIRAFSATNRDVSDDGT